MSFKIESFLWFIMVVAFVIAWSVDSTKWTLAVLGLWIAYISLPSHSRESDKQ